MAVNYVDPPYLPFCIPDGVSLIDYVRIFLSAMQANPQLSGMNFGVAMLAALGRAHPKEECTKH